jgi:Fic family protein
MRKPEPAPNPVEVLPNIAPDRWPRLFEAMSGGLTADTYHHWDDLRFRRPPTDLSKEEWWAALKMSRTPLFKRLPLTDTSGRHFQICAPDVAQRLLHEIDKNLSGHIAMSEVVANPATRDRYVVSSLIEEAITSSQLEGASTTRKVAKEMLRTGRPPMDKSEQMILNNYLAMERVTEISGVPLTPELVLELHRIVSHRTLTSSDAEGRLQSPDDERVAIWSRENTVLHMPPPARELPQRLQAMCEFANGSGQTGFIHPVVRAIVLHFWLAYDHPFEDGNGRTARAVFYWSMLNQRYWLAEFLAISSILRKAPSQYARAFLLTETDENDLTYFLLYQLTVLVRAIGQLQAYLERKIHEVRKTEDLIRNSASLNHRQLALLSHAMRHPDTVYTIESHRNSHRVVYETARSDLLALERRGLLVRSKTGRAFAFMAVDDLYDRLSGRPANTALASTVSRRD